MKVHIELTGGLELLFNKQTKLDIELPSNVATIKDLVFFMKENYLTEKPELFISGDSVRPGILVLINETDWELFDTTEYKLQEKDQIVFISTLHGG